MLSGEKIVLMSKIALHEKKEEKKAMRICRYYRSDYVSFHVIKAIIGITVGYLLLAIMLALYFSESMLNDINLNMVFSVGRTLLLVYLLLIITYGMIAGVLYNIRYTKAKKKMKRYHGYLRRLNNIYGKENS